MTDNPINRAGFEVPSDSPVFLAVLGVHVLEAHITGMGTSYILLLPLSMSTTGNICRFGKELPPIAFWPLPGMMGIPLIARALKRYARLWHSNGTG